MTHFFTYLAKCLNINDMRGRNGEVPTCSVDARNPYSAALSPTTKTRPFYGNIYFLFSIGRVCNYVEDLRKLGTVSIVELHSFFGRNNAEHFKDL